MLQLKRHLRNFIFYPTVIFSLNAIASDDIQFCHDQAVSSLKSCLNAAYPASNSSAINDDRACWQSARASHRVCLQKNSPGNTVPVEEQSASESVEKKGSNKLDRLMHKHSIE